MIKWQITPNTYVPRFCQYFGRKRRVYDKIAIVRHDRTSFALRHAQGCVGLRGVTRVRKLVQPKLGRKIMETDIPIREGEDSEAISRMRRV